MQTQETDRLAESNGKALPAVTLGGSRVRVTKAGLEADDLDGLWRIAKLAFASGLAPKGFETPEKICFAMAQGTALGFTPLDSLRNMAVINGKLGIYGDALPALVQASGQLEKFEERIEGEGDERTAVCVVKRRGMDGTRTERFSVADAKKALLWGKQGPWTQYPDRMLKMRARSFAFRDAFADVLHGLKPVEELADYPEAATETAAAPQPAAPPPVANEPPPIDVDHRPAAKPEPEPAKPAKRKATAHGLEFGRLCVRAKDDTSRFPNGWESVTAFVDRLAEIACIKREDIGPDGDAATVANMHAALVLVMNGTPQDIAVEGFRKAQDGEPVETPNAKPAAVAVSAPADGESLPF